MTGYTDAEIAEIKNNASYIAVQRFCGKNYKRLKRNGITRHYLQDLCNYFVESLRVEYTEGFNVYQKTYYVSLQLYDMLKKELWQDICNYREIPVEFIGELARARKKPNRYSELYNDLYAFVDKDILNDKQKKRFKIYIANRRF